MAEISTAYLKKSVSIDSTSSGFERSTWRQYVNLVILSIRRYLFTRYMWVMIAIGSLPIAFSVIYLISYLNRFGFNVMASYDNKVNEVFQVMFRTLYIHFIIFFVANIFGFSLLRKEVDDRTLHYLFLQPVGKVKVIMSKFAGYLIVTWVFLSITFLLTYFLFQLPYGFKAIVNDLIEKKRAISLMEQCFVMLIALTMYGAVSMVMGSIFKSAWYALIFLLWECGLPYLPSTLKLFTISNYLQALTPEKSAVPKKLFELYGEVPSLLRCFITLPLVLSVLIGITIFLIGQYECKYSES
jgi:ABC-type transport system involved in multi-copper enzyme maturation permease subunit